MVGDATSIGDVHQQAAHWSNVALVKCGPKETPTAGGNPLID